MNRAAHRGRPSGGGRGWRFYGWRTVAVAFLVNFVSAGFHFYAFPVFLTPLAADLGGSRGGVSLAFATSNLVGAALAPFIGRALDSRSIRRVMLFGTALVAAGYLLLARTHELWQLYALFGSLVAAGMAMLGGTASSKLVANWFLARRGTALGIATMGMSLAGILVPTAATWLVERLGWRGGFAVFAACTCVLAPLLAACVVDRPEALGLRPDGERPSAAPEDAAPTAAQRVWRTAEILRSRNFWAIAIPFALVLAALSGTMVHLVSYANDLGITPYRKARVLSAAAAMGLVGKFVSGWLVDRFDARTASWFSFGAQLLGMALLLSGPGYAGLLLAAAVFGFGMGGVVPLHAAAAAAAFGHLSFGKVMGLLRPVEAPLHAAGIPLAGWIYDVTGSYARAFQLFALAYLLAALGLAALRLARAPTPGPGPGASPGEAGLA